MKKIFTLAFCALSLSVYAQKEEPSSALNSANPIVKHVYTCDPAALVDDGKLYIFCGEEKTDTPYNWPFTITNYRILSTTDMVNYTDHGPCLDASAFEWMPDNYCWASQCIKRNCKYYWYVSSWGNIGVAVSDDILGPYKDPLGKPLIDRKTPGHEILNIDPTVFIDEDGQAYLYWGGEQRVRGCKLKENMTELDGDYIEVSGLKNYEEAPWVFKRNDIYYLVYSASNGYRKGPIRYATAKHPLGPWTDQYDILGVVYNSFTNHEAVVEYKGQWYIIYHNGALPYGGDYNRSVCVDKLYFNEDGSIQFVEQTTGGVAGKNEHNNFGPHPYAGVDATAVMPYPVKLNSRVTDDGRVKEPLRWSWTKIKGEGDFDIPGNPNFEAFVYFTEPGDYTLRLTASDGYNEMYDDVNIKVYPEVKGTSYEAESEVNELTKAAVLESQNASAGKVVGYMGGESVLKFNDIKVKKDGVYNVTFYYSNSRLKSFNVAVGDKKVDVPVEGTVKGYFDSFATVTVELPLKKGSNSVILTGAAGVPTIDKLVVGEIVKTK